MLLLLLVGWISGLVDGVLVVVKVVVGGGGLVVEMVWFGLEDWGARLLRVRDRWVVVVVVGLVVVVVGLVEG